MCKNQWFQKECHLISSKSKYRSKGVEKFIISPKRQILFIFFCHTMTRALKKTTKRVREKKKKNLRSNRKREWETLLKKIINVNDNQKPSVRCYKKRKQKLLWNSERTHRKEAEKQYSTRKTKITTIKRKKHNNKSSSNSAADTLTKQEDS